MSATMVEVAAPLVRPSEASPEDLVDILARSPRATLERISGGEGLGAFARGALVTILAGAGAFGASLGFHRGALQALYAGVKLPFAVLLTAAVLTPALTCLNSALGRPADLRRDLSLVLAALARASLVLAAEVPVLWLGIAVDASYHRMVLLAVGTCAVAGVAGLVLLTRGIFRTRRGAVWTTLLLLGGFAIVGAQMSWVLRPYLLRPRETGTPFLRALDGDFVKAVTTTADSARGVYHLSGGY